MGVIPRRRVERGVDKCNWRDLLRGARSRPWWDLEYHRCVIAGDDGVPGMPSRTFVLYMSAKSVIHAITDMPQEMNAIVHRSRVFRPYLTLEIKAIPGRDDAYVRKLFFQLVRQVPVIMFDGVLH